MPGETSVIETSVIGKPHPKVDAPAKVSGETAYADDLVLPRMAYGKLLRSTHPHAEIAAIDTTEAAGLPGVYAVITGQDVPVPYGMLPVSQDEYALAPSRVRYVGDPVAAVAAVDEETAEEATRLIRVQYRPLPAVMSIEQALQDGQVRIHEYGDRPNVHKMVAYDFNDVSAGFAEADYVREDLFFYEGSTHLPMEQQCAVARAERDGRLTLWSSTQTPHYLHRALGRVLDLPTSRIRVIATPSGGGFGGKSDIFWHEICACKLSMLTGRPVKFALTREEVFYAHRGRHPVLTWIKTGVKRDGRITGMHFRSYLDGGAYGSYGVATTYYTGALQASTYHIPRYRFEGVRVFTNKPACGPKRGHGTPQPRFAEEVHLDKIAGDLDMDPVELRRRNLMEPFSYSVNHLRITSCGLKECVERVVEESGWNRRRGSLPPGRGLGFALGSYISGAGLPIYWNKMPHSGIQIRLDRSGEVTVFSGTADIGQGSDSVLAYLVAEVLGVTPGQVRMVTADTSLTPVDLGSYSSRVTFMAGNAAVEAAEPLRRLVADAAAERLEVPAEQLAMRDGRVFEGGNPEHGIPFAEAVQLAEARHGTLGSVGSYTPPRLGGRYKGSGVGPSPAYSYNACVVEVEADPETGQVRVERVWLAHDCGKALNPLLVTGQAEGSIYMGLGEALMEEQAFRKGLHKVPSMLEYKSPTTLETPEMHVYHVESADPEGPFGAKEAGEGPIVSVMPAVANAVHAALGVRIDGVPITPEKVLEALDDRVRRGPGRVGPARAPAVAWGEPVAVDPPPEWSDGR